MIKKIELKIFLIIFVLLSVMIGAIIAYNAYNSYDATIRGSTMYIERIIDDRRNLENESIEGVYVVRVANHKAVSDEMIPEFISEYAQKAIDNNSEFGIIGDYIYRNRNHGGMDKKR